MTIWAATVGVAAMAIGLSCNASQLFPILFEGEFPTNDARPISVSIFQGPALNNRQEMGVLNLQPSSSRPSPMLVRNGSATVLLDVGDTLPDGLTYDGVFNEGLALNDAGTLGFSLDAFGDNPNSGREQIVLQDGLTTTQILREGDPAPGGGLLFTNGVRSVILNEAGQAAFSARLFGEDVTSSSDEGIYRWNPDTGSLINIVRKGQSAPGGGTFTGTAFQSNEQFATPRMNNAGSVIFSADVRGTSFGDQGIFRYDDGPGGGTITNIVRQGDALPGGGTADVLTFTSPAINDAGLVAFTGSVDINSSLEGVYTSDGTGIDLVARFGTPVPGTNRGIRRVSRRVDLSNQGDVVFSSNGGLYVRERGGFLNELVFDGLTTPAGDETFRSYSNDDFSMSANGHIAFTAGVNTSSGTTRALFLFTPGQGLEEVVREGQSFNGSTITDFNFQTSTDNSYSGLNDRGELAFVYRLASGGDGIALWADALRIGVTGDYTGNGQVEQGDLNLVLNNWGGPRGAWSNADGLTTSTVDQEELNRVLNNWGDAAAPSFAANPGVVPEPGSLGLLTVISACMLRRRH
ncbi:MAG: choice-of-anchor tandem repeat NxxGxxAF-containing protein [Planctomycetota bacterium]